MLKLLLILTLATALTSSASGTRPIQDQGSSPYCLFAVDAYLADMDMWRLAADYHRADLPTYDGLVPYNENVLNLITEQAGKRFKVAPQWDTAAARNALKYGPIAVSGHGHALILLSWDDGGRIVYLDSLHSDTPQTMRDRDFWAWSDGWYWWIDHG